MFRASRYRLYPNKAQEQQFQRLCGAFLLNFGRTEAGIDRSCDMIYVQSRCRPYPATHQEDSKP